MCVSYQNTLRYIQSCCDAFQNTPELYGMDYRHGATHGRSQTTAGPGTSMRKVTCPCEYASTFPELPFTIVFAIPIERSHFHEEQRT
jgi:hypothetical protein